VNARDARRGLTPDQLVDLKASDLYVSPPEPPAPPEVAVDPDPDE
jgi:hypothetical protein